VALERLTGCLFQGGRRGKGRAKPPHISGSPKKDAWGDLGLVNVLHDAFTSFLDLRQLELTGFMPQSRL
jgi:hypothetical protein